MSGEAEAEVGTGTGAGGEGEVRAKVGPRLRVLRVGLGARVWVQTLRSAPPAQGDGRVWCLLHSVALHAGADEVAPPDAHAAAVLSTGLTHGVAARRHAAPRCAVVDATQQDGATAQVAKRRVRDEAARVQVHARAAEGAEDAARDRAASPHHRRTHRADAACGGRPRLAPSRGVVARLRLGEAHALGRREGAQREPQAAHAHVEPHEQPLGARRE